MLLFLSAIEKRYAPVAQLDRVTDYESVGRGFESLPAYQKQETPSGVSCFCFPEETRRCKSNLPGAGWAIPAGRNCFLPAYQGKIIRTLSQQEKGSDDFCFRKDTTDRSFLGISISMPPVLRFKTERKSRCGAATFSALIREQRCGQASASRSRSTMLCFAAWRYIIAGMT